MDKKLELKKHLEKLRQLKLVFEEKVKSKSIEYPLVRITDFVTIEEIKSI